MSAIFRRRFIGPRPVQAAALCLTGAATAATVQPAHLARSDAAFAPALRATFAPPHLAETNGVQAPAVSLTGAKLAPFTASGGAIFAPGIAAPATVHATLNLGWAPRQRVRKPIWPNLPVGQALPWRPVIVTPEFARARARALLARRRRAAAHERERDIERRIDGILDRLIDEEVVRIVAGLLGEAA